MTSTEESGEIQVHWPPQPRRPLWPAMKSKQAHGIHMRERTRLAFEIGRHLDLHDDKNDGAEVSSDSEYEEPQGELQDVIYSRENGAQTDQCVQLRNIFFLLVVAVVVIGVCVGVYSKHFLEQEEDDDSIAHLPKIHTNHVNNYFESLLKVDIKDVKKRYPSQKEDLWFQFLAGIKKVAHYQPSQPTTFLLLHTSNAKQTLQCLTKEIARTAAHFLNASEPVTVDGKSLGNMHNQNVKLSHDPKDNGWLIEKYRPLVEERRAMIVYNFEEVPATLAQAFHYFCDEVSPLVDKAVYIFTLSVPQYTSHRAVKVAEDILDNLWSADLTDDIRAPLLTRVTAATVYVFPEEKLPHSCS